MQCIVCGASYRVDDAKSEFNGFYNYDLSYSTEITSELMIPERNMCGHGDIDWMENKIKRQPGYFEDSPEDTGESPEEEFYS